MIHGGDMEMIEMDEYQLAKAAYAEGFDDGINGDNYNPFDYEYKPEEWQAYEDGYLQGVMSGSYDDGQPTEYDEWRDYDPEC